VRHVDGFAKDCFLIQRVAAEDFNILLSLEEAHEMWQAYSHNVFAGWMCADKREDVVVGLKEVFEKIYIDYV